MAKRIFKKKCYIDIDKQVKKGLDKLGDEAVRIMRPIMNKDTGDLRASTHKHVREDTPKKIIMGIGHDLKKAPYGKYPFYGYNRWGKTSKGPNNWIKKTEKRVRPIAKNFFKNI